MMGISSWPGRALAWYLNKPSKRYLRFSVTRPEHLRDCLRPGDVLLVEGDLRISVAIKYLTQSTWSHAALYVGDIDNQERGGTTLGKHDSETCKSRSDEFQSNNSGNSSGSEFSQNNDNESEISADGNSRNRDPADRNTTVLNSDQDEPCDLIEADLEHGVIAVPLSKYADFNTRICRPVGLADEDRDALVRYMRNSLGMAYDLKNVIDLARYLLPTPPVPNRWRRRMLALGSGDPTRAICSTLLAQAFQSIHYPILPEVDAGTADDVQGNDARREILHIRHHSLFAPRDFDISPYFRIVKPTVESGFDYTKLNWAPSHKPGQI